MFLLFLGYGSVLLFPKSKSKGKKPYNLPSFITHMIRSLRRAGIKIVIQVLYIIQIWQTVHELTLWNFYCQINRRRRVKKVQNLSQKIYRRNVYRKRSKTDEIYSTRIREKYLHTLENLYLKNMSAGENTSFSKGHDSYNGLDVVSGCGIRVDDIQLGINVRYFVFLIRDFMFL